MPYQLVICDDNETDCHYLSGLVHEWAKSRKYSICLDLYPSAEAFLFQYAEKKDYDILLLDIEMPSLDGVSLARQIRMENEDINIVFVTGYPDFLAEGYEVAALQYLMKPVDSKKLDAVLDRAIRRRNKSDPVLLLPADGEQLRLRIDAITYIEANAHHVWVHTNGFSFEVRLSITQIQALLEANHTEKKCFIRCHRSYLVNLRAVSRIGHTQLVLDSGECLPLARSAYAQVNCAFLEYYKGVIL